MGWLEIESGAFVANDDTVHDSLPPGRYSITPTPNHLAFVPIEPAVDDYIANPQSRKVLDEIDLFRRMRPRYEKLGLVYKRGVLLHGKPGCGKTTVLNEVSESVIEGGGVVLEGDPRLTQAGYRQLRGQGNTQLVLVLIEDIDQMARSSALTNLLDGSESSSNVLFLATTNYLEKLPERLRNRPSRFDTVVEMTFPKAPVREHFLARLGMDSGHQRDELVKVSDGMSFAHLKELFIATQLYGQDAKAAVARLTKKPIEFASSDDPALRSSQSRIWTNRRRLSPSHFPPS